jgi:hypothetical protein
MTTENPYLELVNDTKREAENPYLPIVQGDVAQQARTSVAGVADINPDADAKLQQLASKYGVPVDAARLDPKPLERKDKLDSIDYTELAKRAPGTANFMSNPNNAAIAHDDTDNMSLLEKTLSEFGKAARYIFSHPANKSTLLGDLGSGVYRASEGVAGAARAAVEFPAPLLDPLVGRIFPDNPLRRVASGIAEFGRAANKSAKALSPDDPTIVGGGVSSGVQSLAQNMLMLPLAFVPGGQGAILPLMGGLTFGQEYQKAREKNVPMATALPFATSQGIIEYATEKIPMSRLLGDLSKNLPLRQLITRQIAAEVPGEQVATLLQDFNDFAVLHPEKSFKDYLNDRPGAAAQTLIATIVGVGGNVAVMKTLDAAFTDTLTNSERARTAESNAILFARLDALASASKVRERDVSSFETFVAAATENGPVQDVFINAQTLAQPGVAEQLVAVSPSVAEQFQTALETGNDIRIPVAEYTARIAGTDLSQSLVEHLKTEADGFSQAEAKQYMQSHAEELKQDIERTLAAKQGDETFRAQVESVKTNIKAQLDAAGRFTSQVNDAYASMVGNFYGVMAGKLGITPEELLARYPLRVQAQSIVDGQKYDQSGNLITDTPEFTTWFNDSKVVSPEGTPMVLYHGTVGLADRSSMGFDTFNTKGRELGSHFGTVKQSNAFVKESRPNGRIYPVYLSIKNPLRLIDKGAFDAKGVMDQLVSLGIATAEQAKSIKALTNDNQQLDAMQALIKAAGYDGVVYLNRREGLGQTNRKAVDEMTDDEVRAKYSDAADSYIAFDSAQIKSAIGNNGQFNENDPSILKQGETTDRGAFEPATSTITLLKKADLSTFLHESGHAFLEMQFDIAARIDPANIKPGEQQILDDTAQLLKWFGVRDLAEWNGLDFEEKRSYHETFARGYEAYLFEGKAPSIEVQGLFQRFSAWLLDVYKDLKKLNVELTDEVRAVFDRMLATNEQIELAQQARSMMALFTAPGQAGLTVEQLAAYQALGIDATNDAIQDLQARGLRDLAWSRNARGREIKKLQKQAAARRAEVTIDVRREVMSQPIYRAWQFLTGKLTPEDKIAPAELPKSDPNVLDESIDSLFTAIAKLGGLDRTEVEKQWGFDPKEKSPMPVFGKYTLRREGGLSIDAMAEALAERGYLSKDESDRFDQRELEEKFDAELRGDVQYSNSVDERILRGVGKSGEDLNVEALGAGRFELGELKTMGLPPTIVEIIQNLKMTAKNGLHPDVVSDMFGFTSGDELLRTLAIAQDPKQEINDQVDARMLELYGELATPEAIEREADKAIHNENRARVVATEANALAQATGKPKILAAAAKEFARTMIARLKIRDIRPGQYASAEVRAAKAAQKASQSGDLATAAAEKRNQLVNTYATKAAYDAQDEVEAGVRYLKKFDNDGTRKNLDADYLDQIDALLDRFDLRKLSNKAMDKRTALAGWLKSQEEQGLAPDISEELENEAFRKPYKEMTVEEFRGLIDAVKQIEHLGRLKNRLLTAADNRAFAAVRDEIVQSIQDNAGDRQADTRTPTTNLGRLYASTKSFFASHIKAAFWARIMDGGKDGGSVWEYLVRPANERGDMETTMRATATIRLSEILKPVLALGKMGVFFPSINRSFNRESRLAIALNTGNEGNLQRLLGGEGWTAQQLAPVLATLSAAEWRAVQEIWDHFETYRPQIAAKERRVYGKEPNWVEPTPFQIKTSDGETLDLRGGYYPIKYDPAASQRAEEYADAEGAKRQLQGAFTSATTRRSFTKARAEEIVGRPLIYTLAGLYSGVNDVIHDLAWHEWLIDANRLLRSKTIDSAIRNAYGPQVKAQFKTWTQDIAEGDKGASNAGEMALGRLRQGVSAAGLGFNVMSAAMQVLGFTQSIVRIGPAYVGKGIAQFIANPIAAIREVNAKSELMANRSRTMFRELNELRNQVQDESAAGRAVKAGAFYMMARAQQMVDTPTWLGAYNKAIHAGQTEERSVALADQSVIDAQGGGQTKDLSSIERGGPAQKLFTVFYSFMNTALNLAVGQTMTANTPAKKAKLAADYLLLFTIPSVLGYVLKQALMPAEDKDEDWDELARKLAAEQISYLMGTMVLVREFAAAGKIVMGVEGVRDYSGPAGVRAISDAYAFGKQAMQLEFDDAFRKAAINLLGDLTGLPAAQANRTITGVQALVEGDTRNPAAVVFGFERK